MAHYYYGTCTTSSSPADFAPHCPASGDLMVTLVDWFHPLLFVFNNSLLVLVSAHSRWMPATASRHGLTSHRYHSTSRKGYAPGPATVEIDVNGMREWCAYHWRYLSRVERCTVHVTCPLATLCAPNILAWSVQKPRWGRMMSVPRQFDSRLFPKLPGPASRTCSRWRLWVCVSCSVPVTCRSHH